MLNRNLNFRRYFTANSVLILLAQLLCVSCSGQVNKQQSSSKESTVAAGSRDMFQQRDSLIVNQYKDGKKDGLWRDHYQNGQLKSEGSYTAGLKEGVHREWEDNGILLLEGTYNQGKENGVMRWFHERGHLAGEGNMVDGIRNGPWEICDIQENGFCIDAYFKNGKRDGTWKIYHEEDMDKIWKEQVFKADKIISEKCWDVAGKAIECK